MKIKAAVISTGYVEENAIAGVPVYHNTGFNSVEELLGAFGRAVIGAYWTVEQYHRRPGKCCISAKNKYPDHKICHECGRSLQVQLEPTEERGVSYCHEFLHGTCDSIPHDVWEEVERQGWNFYSFTNVIRANIVVEVHSYGAELMWHCSYGEVGTGMPDAASYSVVLGHHVRVISRKTFKCMPSIYKE